MSLPVYSNIFDYINSNSHVKPIDEKSENEQLNAKSSDEIKFSKLKISSPASSTSSAASSSSSSAHQYLNIKTEASLMDDTISGGVTSGNLLFDTDDPDDVINVFSRNVNNNNNNNNSNSNTNFDQQQQHNRPADEDDHNDSLFNDLNQIVVLNFGNNNDAADDSTNVNGSKMDQLDVNNQLQQSWVIIFLSFLKRIK